MVAGTTYDTLWRLVKRLSNGGLFNSAGSVPVTHRNLDGGKMSLEIHLILNGHSETV